MELAGSGTSRVLMLDTKSNIATDFATVMDLENQTGIETEGTFVFDQVRCGLIPNRLTVAL